jgi:hypothetical protein
MVKLVASLIPLLLPIGRLLLQPAEQEGEADRPAADSEEALGLRQVCQCSDCYTLFVVSFTELDGTG